MVCLNKSQKHIRGLTRTDYVRQLNRVATRAQSRLKIHQEPSK